jgi:antitoxin component YwqK of YwqJK toxin-antitoxin module
MRPILSLILFILSQALYSQGVPSYESFEADPSTVYYTLLDTTANITLEEGQYIDGERHGTWIKRWPNGDIQAILKFVEGRRKGVWRFWDEEGNLVYRKKFNRKGELILAAQYRYY